MGVGRDIRARGEGAAAAIPVCSSGLPEGQALASFCIVLAYACAAAEAATTNLIAPLQQRLQSASIRTILLLPV